MISSRTTNSWAIRRLGASIIGALCCLTLPVGCGGDPGAQETSIPAEFAEKLEKEHPELFVKKVGRNKTEKLEGRDKRNIIRREWLKSQQGNP